MQRFHKLAYQVDYARTLIKYCVQSNWHIKAALIGIFMYQQYCPTEIHPQFHPPTVTPGEDVAHWFRRHCVHSPKARTWTEILAVENHAEPVWYKLNDRIN